MIFTLIKKRMIRQVRHMSKKMKSKRPYDTSQIFARFNFKYLFRIWRYALPFKFWVIFIFLCMGFVTATSVIEPLCTSYIIDHIIPAQNYAGLIRIAVIIALLHISGIIVEVIKHYTARKYEHKILNFIRKDLFDKLQKVYFDYFDVVPSGKILLQLTDYVNGLQSFYAVHTIKSIFGVLQLIVVFIVLMNVNIPLTLVIFGIMIIIGIIAAGMRADLMRKNRIMKISVGNSAAFNGETITGLLVSKSYEKEGENETKFNELNRYVEEDWYDIVTTHARYSAMISFLWNFTFMAVYAVAFFLVRQGHMMAGTVIAFSAYINQVYNPLMTIIDALKVFAESSASLERIFDLLDYPIKVKEKENAYDLPPVKGNIKFENINFSYDNNVSVLENFNLDVKAGSKVALIGKTGAGKTTVANLLVRFYDPTSGNIYIDGHNVGDVTTKSLRRQVGMMMQDSFIFTGTIIDNIRYGKENATDEDCIEAAKKIGIDEIIHKFPDGYYERLSENGGELSEGEKQLICFARIILNNPSVLILDEATSNIDSLTEEKLLKAFKTVTEGRTCLIIAHRLSTIKEADNIVCIGDKNIIEQGNHEALMAKKGYYYNLKTIGEQE